jgi:hypothetical protein
MSPWEDISTEQLREDISIDQQELAESHLTPRLFGQILGRIERLAWHPT